MVKRINYIDALRGFTMFLVVFGHVLSKTFCIEPYSTFVSSFFLTFRMPMFFFISGYIAYKNIDNWTSTFYLKRISTKARVQIIPATLFFFLSCYCSGKYINPIIHGWGGYWFTFVLFEMFVFYFSLSFIGRYTSEKIVDVGMILLSILGVLWLTTANRNYSVYNFLCMENLTKYMQFFTFGVLCKKYNTNFIKFIKKDSNVTVIMILFVVCLLVYYNEDVKRISFVYYSFVHDVLVRYLGLLVLFCFFYSKKDYFDKDSKVSKVFLYVGRRTLDIYLIHFFLLPHMEYMKAWIVSNGIFIQLSLTTIITVIIIAFCLIISEVIRTSKFLAYLLFGVKIKD